ncbi:unnamed protein product [Durusdinium trenchii]|uniref:Uncharacterized protein n=1 Tax=Durusdinium trenchii TaxID=1381693 RepID=A0ABP0PC82_9DINO
MCISIASKLPSEPGASCWIWRVPPASTTTKDQRLFDWAQLPSLSYRPVMGKGMPWSEQPCITWAWRMVFVEMHIKSVSTWRKPWKSRSASLGQITAMWRPRSPTLAMRTTALGTSTNKRNFWKGPLPSTRGSTVRITMLWPPPW